MLIVPAATQRKQFNPLAIELLESLKLFDLESCGARVGWSCFQ